MLNFLKVESFTDIDLCNVVPTSRQLNSLSTEKYSCLVFVTNTRVHKFIHLVTTITIRADILAIIEIIAVVILRVLGYQLSCILASLQRLVTLGMDFVHFYIPSIQTVFFIIIFVVDFANRKFHISIIFERKARRAEARSRVVSR